MTRNRLNMLIAGVAMAVVALGAFFLGVQPQLAQAADARSQQHSVEATNATTSKELSRLRERAKSLPELRAQLAKLRASVPASASMSSFYKELDAVASSAGVTVSAITTSDAIAYTAPSSSSASGTGTDGSTASATSEPTATASASAAPSATTDSRISGSNFSVIPVSVSVDGSFAQALSFVRGIQAGSRLFLIDSITSSASQDATGSSTADATTWTFGGSVYVLSGTEQDTSANG